MTTTSPALICALVERVQGALLALEDAGGALEDVGVEAGALDDGALRSHRAVQDGDAAGLVDRVVQGAEDLAVQVRRVDRGEVLGDGLAGDGEAVAVQQAGVEQCPHDDRHAADLVDVGHHVAAERLEVAQVRDPVADAVEVVERQLHLGLAGDGEQVQHGVGGAAEGHGHGDGVLERLLGHDVAGGDAQAQQVDHGLAGLAGEVVAAAVGRGRRGRAGQGHAEGLADAGHGVGGVHAAAGAFARADGLFDAGRGPRGSSCRRRRRPRPRRRR